MDPSFRRSYSGSLVLRGCSDSFTCVFPFEAPKAENSKANPVKYVQCEGEGGGRVALEILYSHKKTKETFFFRFLHQESLFWATKLLQVSAGNHRQQPALLLEPPHLLL